MRERETKKSQAFSIIHIRQENHKNPIKTEVQTYIFDKIYKIRISDCKNSFQLNKANHQSAIKKDKNIIIIPTVLSICYLGHLSMIN